MALKIENLKLDKEVYTFGVDKEIKGSFTLISDGKDYKINSVNIKHGVIFYLFLDKKSEYIKNITICKNVQILGNEPQKFEFIIPINYPNKDNNISNSPMFNNCIGFKNFIKINIDIKFNPFDIEEENYPNIILDERLTNENFSYLEKTDHINKSFYKSLIKKHISFFIYDKVKKLNNDKSVLLIFITIFISLLLAGYISHYYRKYDNVLSLGLLLIFILTIFFSLIVQISIKKIKNSYVDIKFNSKGVLKRSLESELKISDIFKSIKVNYDGMYSCNLNVYIFSTIYTTKSKGWGESRRIIEYEIPIYVLKIGSYNGDNLKLENINFENKFDDKIKIQPQKFKNNFRVQYKILYSFESKELFNKYGEIIIN